MIIQMDSWLLWLMLTIMLYVALFILVPIRVIKQLAAFGFWFGFVQAIVITWLLQVYLKVFRLAGDPTFFGIPIFTAIAWIAPTIIFAAYFPKNKTWYYYPGYILVFAFGAVGTQMVLEQMGLWESIRWNPVLTFLLALVPHSIMSIYIYFARARAVL